MDVSDRSLQAKLTQKAKITSACLLSEVIFAFGGFIDALSPMAPWGIFVCPARHSGRAADADAMAPPCASRICLCARPDEQPVRREAKQAQQCDVHEPALPQRFIARPPALSPDAGRSPSIIGDLSVRRMSSPPPGIYPTTGFQTRQRFSRLPSIGRSRRQKSAHAFCMGVWLLR